MNKRENIYSLEGFSKVFRFTMSQTFKNKGYLVSFVAFVLVMSLMGPIQYLGQHFGESSAEESISYNPSNVSIDKLYIVNSVSPELTIDDVQNLYNVDSEDEENDGLTKDKIEIKSVADDADEGEQAVLDSLGKKEAAIFIASSETGFKISGILSKDSEVEVDDIDGATEVVKDTFEKVRLEKCDVSDEDVEMIFKGIDTSSVVEESDYISEENKSISRLNYMFYMLGYSMIVFVVIKINSITLISTRPTRCSGRKLHMST